MVTEVLLNCFSSKQVRKRTVEERRRQNLCDKHNSNCLKKISAKLYHLAVKTRKHNIVK